MSGVIEYLSLARLSSRTVECIEFNYENGILSMVVLHFEGGTVLTVSATDIDCPLVTEIEGELMSAEELERLLREGIALELERMGFGDSKVPYTRTGLLCMQSAISAAIEKLPPSQFTVSVHMPTEHERAERIAPSIIIRERI